MLSETECAADIDVSEKTIGVSTRSRLSTKSACDAGETDNLKGEGGRVFKNLPILMKVQS